MDVIMLLARLVLAIVFIVASVAKIADRQRATGMLADFGVSPRLAPALAIGVAFLELGIAVALLDGPTVWWGGVSALILLVGFSTVIAVNLAQGRAPECRCFGQISAKPIGSATLIRNSVLGALAVVVVAYGRDGAGANTVGWLVKLSTAERLYLVTAGFILAVLVLEAWLLIRLLAQNGRLALRLEALEQAARTLTADSEGLAPGTPAPPITLPDIEGNAHTLESLGAAGKPLVLLFIDPDCGPCNALLPEVAGWQGQSDHFMLALISRGAVERNRASARHHGLARLLIQQDDEVMQSYHVSATPTVVIVNSAGAIADFPAVGDIAIRGVLARLLSTAPESARQEIRDRISASGKEFVLKPAHRSAD